MIIPVDICNRSTFSLCASDISCTFGFFLKIYTSQKVTIQSIAQVNDPVEVTEIIFFVRHLCLWTFHFFKINRHVLETIIKYLAYLLIAKNLFLLCLDVSDSSVQIRSDIRCSSHLMSLLAN